MKKIVSLFLVAIIITSLFAGSVYAEDFTIHSGVVFGDTKEDVKAKENLSLKDETATSLTYEGVVAGLDHSDILYEFNDKTKKLYEAFYVFPTDNKGGQWKNFLERLKNKYGNTLSEKDELYNIWGKIDFLNDIEYLNYTKYPHEYTATAWDISKFFVWVIPCGDNIVRITLINKGNMMVSRNYLDYRIFTDEEIAQLETINNDSEQQIMDDL